MKGIPFNDDMVRAILEDRKSQTRRPIKRLEEIGPITEFQKSDTKRYDWILRDKDLRWNDFRHADLLDRCPYGKVGDRLFVKEAFCLEEQVESDQEPPFNDGRPTKNVWDDRWQQPHYRATDPPPELAYEDSDGEPTVRWKPPQNMPKWVARIFLEITEIRVERVQEISEEDARAEGCCNDIDWSWYPTYFDPDSGGNPTYRGDFEYLWNSIYEKKGFGWNKNPWVWVIEFKRVQKR